MKKILESIKGGTIFGFSALVVMILGGTIYAVVNNTWTIPNSLEATSGSILTSEAWNKILSNFETLKGQISAFNLSKCPDGWLPADGNGGRPDLRGVFIRGANNFGTGTGNTIRDMDRYNNGSLVGTYQEDGIRNITGKLDSHLFSTSTITAFYAAGGAFLDDGTVIGTGYYPQLLYTVDFHRITKFDASFSVGVEHIGEDNRPRNVALIYCVKE